MLLCLMMLMDKVVYGIIRLAITLVGEKETKEQSMNRTNIEQE